MTEQPDSDAGIDANLLLPLVYEELRRIASNKLAGEKTGQTLQATALVHEAWLAVSGKDPQQRWNHRGHFFAAASEAMRRILIDSAKRKKRVKHGGDRKVIPLEAIEISDKVPVDEALAIDELLDELEKADRQAAELVKLRYFVGLSTEEAADALQISARTAYRDWQFARAWLHKRMNR